MEKINNMLKFQGTIQRVIFHDEDTNYTVMSISPDIQRGTITVKAHLAYPAPGMPVILTGDWEHDKNYGREFKAVECQVTTPSTTDSLFRYLSGGTFPGIGPGLAKKIIDKFGDSAIDIIEKEPNKLLEIPKFGEARLNRFINCWVERRAINDIMLFLHKHGLSTKFAMKIYHQYGDKTFDVLEENPYILADDIDGISFAKADAIALSMGIWPDSEYRIAAAINHVLTLSSNAGNTYDLIPKVINEVTSLINIGSDKVLEILDDMVDDEKLVKIGNMLFLPLIRTCEMNIASHIVELINRRCQDERASDKDIARVEAELGITYSEKQKEVLKNATASNIFVITGGPGTGKTTIIKGLIRLFEKRGERIKCAAPTGKAADRMAEATRFEAKTVHRMLKYTKDGGSTYSREANSLPTDVLIVDEVSMMNVPLMNSLLKSLSYNTKLILVGDNDQLPCIGPGNILSDIIISGLVPYVKLDYIFRQSDTSEIILAAHDVNSGKMPTVTNSKESDFFFLTKDTDEEIKATIIDLVRNRLPAAYGYSPSEIQVIAPMKDGIVGVTELNSALQEALNAHGKEVKWGGFIKFRQGDKVMQTKNNYKKDVFNGEYGVITEVNNEEKFITVSYKNRDIEYDYTELDELMLSYAITVHKPQGSEYPVVIMPVTRSHYTMIKRNLVYTGITRAKKLCVLLGDAAMLAHGARTQDTIKRRTYLDATIKEMMTINSMMYQKVK